MLLRVHMALALVFALGATHPRALKGISSASQVHLKCSFGVREAQRSRPLPAKRYPICFS